MSGREFGGVAPQLGADTIHSAESLPEPYRAMIIAPNEFRAIAGGEELETFVVDCPGGLDLVAARAAYLARDGRANSFAGGHPDHNVVSFEEWLARESTTRSVSPSEPDENMLIFDFTEDKEVADS